MNPYDLAHQLARSLKESQEFSEFKQAKAVVDVDQKKKEMVEDFRKKQMEIQSKQMMGHEMEDEEMQKLNNLYSIVSADQEIKRLIQAEMRLAQLLSDIYKIIGDALKSEEEQQ